MGIRRIVGRRKAHGKPTPHWNVQEAADILHISPEDVWREVKDGKLIMEEAGITRKSLIMRILRRVANA